MDYDVGLSNDISYEGRRRHLILSSIVKGGVLLAFKILSSVSCNSISPVGILGFFDSLSMYINTPRSSSVRDTSSARVQ